MLISASRQSLESMICCNAPFILIVFFHNSEVAVVFDLSSILLQ